MLRTQFGGSVITNEHGTPLSVIEVQKEYEAMESQRDALKADLDGCDAALAQAARWLRIMLVKAKICPECGRDPWGEGARPGHREDCALNGRKKQHVTGLMGWLDAYERENA